MTCSSPSEEWVEIIEPRTQEHMFANLTTGECVWDPPEGVQVKKTNENQWWELFDANTGRFYYYNATSQKTVWHRPSNCDIIPLAKLQTLKQNTEVRNNVVEVSKSNQDAQTLGPTELTRQPLPSGSGSTTRTKLTRSQTSPVDSPRVVRRSRNQRSQLAGKGLTSPKSTDLPVEFSHRDSSRYKSKRRPQNNEVTPTSSPQKTSSQRYLNHFERASNEDKRRTTIGPAQAKYYSIPTSTASKLQSPEDQVVQSKPQRHVDPSFASSISRSISFMSRQPPSRGGGGDEPGWMRSSVESRDSGGRRSVESTPKSGRRGPQEGPPQAEVTSPVEGFCTPLINRKHGWRPGREQAQANNSGSQKQSPESQSHDDDQLSITNLMESGLSLIESNGAVKNGNKHVSHHRATHNRLVKESNGMSPLQQYILDQHKMSGYRFGDPLDNDRDSFVESEDDFRRGDESDDFADDEDGGVSDTFSKASSVDGEDDRYLSEPTYSNLDPVWVESVHGYQSPANVKSMYGHHGHMRPPEPSPRTRRAQVNPDIDAFSEEFDIKMRSSHNKVASSSTMPRPASHQPTSSLKQQQQQQQQQQQHQFHHQQNPAYPVPYDVLHPSLQRNTHSLHLDMSSPVVGTSTLGRNTGSGAGRSRARAVSEKPYGGSSLSVSASLHSTISCESDIEKYALDNFNVQKKGLFRRKMTVKDILTHTKESINKPLTCLSERSAKKEALIIFRLVQIYMGDRRAKQGMTINSVALDIITKAFTTAPLRDELFVQLCKQTTDNVNSRESLRRGWELIAICLSFFPPSAAFGPALASYIQRHRDPAFDYPDVGKWPIHVQISHYAGICAKRLDRIGEGGRLSPKKPTVEEIDQSRLQIFRPSMFGGTLSEAMDIQRDRFPQRKLPWILTTLVEQIMQLNGATTEGIFRVPADLDEVMSVKSRFDQWEVPKCADCHTAASLLKLWLRELYEPLIPDELYEECVRTADDKEGLEPIMARMPSLNKDVLTFLIRFLQFFARSEVANVTKMDAANLGTVFAPNCLRCPSSDPAVMMENTRKEMAFVKNLIFNLDTSSAEGVL